MPIHDVIVKIYNIAHRIQEERSVLDGVAGGLRRLVDGPGRDYIYHG